jgi:hypothetical protein
VLRMEGRGRYVSYERLIFNSAPFTLLLSTFLLFTLVLISL